MAKFDKKTLGTASGAIGDIVFKTRKGKTYIASRPSSVKKSMSPESVKNREKFRFSQKLFAELGKIFWFKYIWINSEIEADSFINKMFKLNYKRIDNELDFSKIFLIPVEDGYDAELTSHSLGNNTLTATISLPETEAADKKVSFQGVICLSNPSDTSLDPYIFRSFFTDDIIRKTGEPLVYTVPFVGNEADEMNKYQTKKILCNLLTKNKEGKPTNVSVNIYFVLG